MKMIKLHLVMIAFLMSMLMGVTVSEAQEAGNPTAAQYYQSPSYLYRTDAQSYRTADQYYQ